MKLLSVHIFLLLSIFSFGQEKIEPVVDKIAHPIGGKNDLDFIIKTQMIYPKTLLREKQDVVIHFNVMKDGTVKNIEFKNVYKDGFKKEATRLLKYVVFKPAKIGANEVNSQTSLTINFSPDLYRKATKSRGFIIPKEIDKMDTSFTIYERADASPEYYKGNDELIDFINKNLEYPDLAIRQNIQGTVILNFIVEPNGYISNLYIEKEFNHLCTQEAYRIMKDIKWKPAIKDGKYVRYKMKYPIVFSLNNVNKDNATGEQR